MLSRDWRIAARQNRAGQCRGNRGGAGQGEQGRTGQFRGNRRKPEQGRARQGQQWTCEGQRVYAAEHFEARQGRPAPGLVQMPRSRRCLAVRAMACMAASASPSNATCASHTPSFRPSLQARDNVPVKQFVPCLSKHSNLPAQLSLPFKHCLACLTNQSLTDMPVCQAC